MPIVIKMLAKLAFKKSRRFEKYINKINRLAPSQGTE